jgi:SinI restriction endonuclease
MALIENAEAIAEQEWLDLNPELLKPFAQILQFYAYSPASLPEKRGKQPTGGVDHIKSLVKTYHKARLPNRPEKPATVPDPLVSFILENYFDVPERHLERASEQHLLAMAAENMVGDLLERYLAKILEPTGWVWCAGSAIIYFTYRRIESRENETGRRFSRNENHHSARSARVERRYARRIMG